MHSLHMTHSLTNLSNKHNYDHHETISYEEADGEICAAQIQIHPFRHILHTRPGLAKMDYCAVVYSIIFCNGISAL